MHPVARETGNPPAARSDRLFYGWWITAACFCTFGLTVGIPYYCLPFFYDYFEQPVSSGGFGWTRSSMMLGFPLAALATIWAGPLLAHRFRPRTLILFGSAATALSFAGFAAMRGELAVYYGLWLLYMIGYICSGPIPHQVLISRWFHKMRGRAMGLMYVGVGLGGALSAQYVARPLSETLGFRAALAIIGGSMFLVWPFALRVLRDSPAEMGLEADGTTPGTAPTTERALTLRELLRSPAFWLILAGSICSIGAIGAVNQHMKLIFKDRGFWPQATLNYAFGQALFVIMVSSISGRVVVGWTADHLSKKWLTFAMYSLVAATIPLLLAVRPPGTPYLFSALFGLAMGADYMLIPLIASEQFGAASLARVMGIVLPADMIGLTWMPFGVSIVREHTGNYSAALLTTFALAACGAALIAMLPKPSLAGPLDTDASRDDHGLGFSNIRP
jgi:MFS family permease